MWIVTVFVLIQVNRVVTQLNTFHHKTVFDFLRSASGHNISSSCIHQLSQIVPFLSDKTKTIPQQKEFFASSFSSGNAEHFSTTDVDRWVFRTYECIQSAGEAVYSAAEFPLLYCYGSNQVSKEKNATVYGICIPDGCYSDRTELLEGWRLLTSEDEEHIDGATCLRSRHEKQWYQRAIPLAEFSVQSIVMLLVVFSTVYDLRKGKAARGKKEDALLAFSALRNLKKLIEMPKDSRSTITCMFGIRFISMVWTIIGHCFMFVQAFIENVDDYKNDVVNSFWNQWISNVTLTVDTFFLLGSTLTAYIWFKKVSENKDVEPTWTSWGYWLRYYRHRVIRLWPAYIFAISYIGMRASSMHFHRIWPQIDPSVQCVGHWWENLLFLNTIFPNRCMPWTWYIGTEFIFYLISPIYLLTLRQSPKIGFSLAFGTIIASSIARGIAMCIWNFPPTQFFWKQNEMFNPDFIQHHLTIYVKPQYRIGPYIVGLLLGYHLAGLQQLTLQPTYSLRFQLFGWICALVAGLWALFGLYPALQAWNAPIYHLIYGSVHRTVFSMSLAWLLYMCHIGKGGLVNTVLSCKLFLPLSSLSYSVYLVHMVMVILTFVMTPFPFVYKSVLPILAHCVVQIVLSYFVAVVCALLLEIPAVNLERVLFLKDYKGTAAVQSQTKENMKSEVKVIETDEPTKK